MGVHLQQIVSRQQGPGPPVGSGEVHCAGLVVGLRNMQMQILELPLKHVPTLMAWPRPGRVPALSPLPFPGAQVYFRSDQDRMLM